MHLAASLYSNLTTPVHSGVFYTGCPHIISTNLKTANTKSIQETIILCRCLDHGIYFFCSRLNFLDLLTIVRSLGLHGWGCADIINVSWTIGILNSSPINWEPSYTTVFAGDNSCNLYNYQTIVGGWGEHFSFKE